MKIMVQLDSPEETASAINLASAIIDYYMGGQYGSLEQRLSSLRMVKDHLDIYLRHKECESLFSGGVMKYE